jgi:CTP:molybdopterin cytidylyltransferase MocA
MPIALIAPEPQGTSRKSLSIRGVPSMTTRSCQVVILAAGEGMRMKSALSKVMHPVAGLPMLGHVLRAADAVGASRAAVVKGPAGDDVAALAAKLAPTAEVFTQVERRGTAHAVLAARAALEQPADDVIVLYGDTPLIRPETLARLREALELGAAVAVLGFRTANPTGYGRLIVEDGQLTAIREEKDASAWERSLNLCNAGVMAFSGPAARTTPSASTISPMPWRSPMPTGFASSWSRRARTRYAASTRAKNSRWSSASGSRPRARPRWRTARRWWRRRRCSSRSTPRSGAMSSSSRTSSAGRA